MTGMTEEGREDEREIELVSFYNDGSSYRMEDTLERATLEVGRQVRKKTLVIH